MQSTHSHLRRRSAHDDLRQFQDDGARRSGTWPQAKDVQTTATARLGEQASSGDRFETDAAGHLTPPLRRRPDAHPDLRGMRALHTPSAAGARFSRSEDSRSRLRPQPAVNDLQLMRLQQQSGVATHTRAPATPPPYPDRLPPYEAHEDLAPLRMSDVELLSAVPRPTSPAPQYQPIAPRHAYHNDVFANYASGLDTADVQDEGLPPPDDAGAEHEWAGVQVTSLLRPVEAGSDVDESDFAPGDIADD